MNKIKTDNINILENIYRKFKIMVYLKVIHI